MPSTDTHKRPATHRRASPKAAAVRGILEQMTRAEAMPVKRRRAVQRSQLHRLLSHAVRQVPFYRERLGEAGFRPDRPLTEEIWRRIPLLSRQEIQAHSESLQALSLPAGHGPSKESMTSGSTGIPLRVTKTALSSLYWNAVRAREVLWHARDTRLPWHSIRYFPEGRALYPRGVTNRNWGDIAEIIGETGRGYGLNIMTDPGDQLAWLERHSPSYLLTYPSNLLALLDATGDRARPFPELRQVVTVAESLHEDLRAQCLARWGARICDVYSATETGYIALQAPQGDHYLVQDEVVRVELLDDEDQPVPPGGHGRVVVTPLHNYAMPLIRYAIGDYAEAGERSPCGRTLPVINRILGRVRNMLHFPDGRRVWPSFADGRFREIAPVRQFRVIQRTLDTLELQVACERPLRPAERNALAVLVRDRVGHPFAVSVTEHGEIPRSAGGKYEDFRNEVAS